MNKKTGIIVGILVITFIIGSAMLMNSNDNTNGTNTGENNIVETDDTKAIKNTAEIINDNNSSASNEVIEDINTPTLSNTNNDNTPTQATKDVGTSINPSVTTVSASETIVYSLPRGGEGTLQLDLELEDGVVSSLQIEHLDVSSSSIEHHEFFDDANLEENLIGQALEDIDDVRISGASLTSEAFNQAVSTLQNQL